MPSEVRLVEVKPLSYQLTFMEQSKLQPLPPPPKGEANTGPIGDAAIAASYATVLLVTFCRGLHHLH